MKNFLSLLWFSKWILLMGVVFFTVMAFVADWPYPYVFGPIFAIGLLIYAEILVFILIKGWR